MEQLDTDLDYMERRPRPSNPAARMNILLILPTLGLLLIAVFILSAILQLDLSGIIDALMGSITLFFLIWIALMFWALAPRRSHS